MVKIEDRTLIGKVRKLEFIVTEVNFRGTFVRSFDWRWRSLLRPLASFLAVSCINDTFVPPE